MSVSPSGFALRMNGSCQTSEVDCGATVAPYRACCPSGSFCPSQYNVDASQTLSLQDMDADSAQCCPTSANCTNTLLQNPQCANQTWGLYDNGGYFCCQKGVAGYAATTDSDGCASPGYIFRSGEILLEIVSTGQGIFSL
jgi:hypothetical protein